MAAKTNKPLPLPPPPRSPRLIAICTVATIALVAADLITKEWAEENLSVPYQGQHPPVCAADEQGYIAMQRLRTEPVDVIDEHLQFRYAENCGAAFGMFREMSPIVRKAVFGTAAIAASIALFVMFVRGRGGALFAWSVPMIVSGALGNLVDRVRYGYVVDFIRAYNLPLPFLDEWPTFNIADCGITVGVALLVLDGFRKPQEATLPDAEEPAPSKPKRRSKKRGQGSTDTARKTTKAKRSTPADGNDTAGNDTAGNDTDGNDLGVPPRDAAQEDDREGGVRTTREGAVND
jgi:signal peptidase II